MKNLYTTALLALMAWVFSACEDKHTESYVINKPILKSFEEWRSEEIKMQAPRTPSATGKIYSYQQYLLINEPMEGIHFFDNSDPSSPVNLGFLPLHGNVDMAIRNNQLYVDAYTDLLTFDISNITSPQLSCRIEDAFVFTAVHEVPGYDDSYPMKHHSPAAGVVTGWTQEKVTNVKNQQLYHPEVLSSSFGPTRAFSEGGANISVGTGGSMAMFTVAKDHLYTLRPNRLESYDLSTQCPTQRQELFINRTAETIFPYQDHLFIGTTTGMIIYSISSPASPAFVSDYPHISACDPVVVQNDRAYVTLRTGNRCVGTVNQLLVIDVSNLSQPQLISSYDLTNPHGLGIDGPTLFVCDGSDGLKVFDASDDMQILQNSLGHFPGIDAYDVIPLGNVLLTSAKDGLYQYDYSDPSAISLISKIAVQ